MSKPFECASGSYTGDGTGFAITLGFKPDMIVAFDETVGDKVWIYLDGMADAKVISISDKVYLIAAAAITLSATGFTVGSANEVCVAGSVFKYVAIGGN